MKKADHIKDNHRQRRQRKLESFVASSRRGRCREKLPRGRTDFSAAGKVQHRKPFGDVVKSPRVSIH